MREARQFEVETLLVLASQDVIDRLLDEMGHLAELEEFIGKPIRLQAKALYPQQYDVMLIRPSRSRFFRFMSLSRGPWPSPLTAS